MTDVTTLSPPPVAAPAATLVSAIAAVMAEVHTVAKRGVNQFHKYNYAKMEDILQEVTPLLGRHGLVIFQSETGRADRLQQRLKPHALPQQLEIGKAHLPGRWPRHDSTQQTQKCRPKANRSAFNPAGDVGRLLGVAANHLSNERHRASHSQAKLAAEKRWKWRFCRTILPFATETS
jgi:hypothetical protein